MNERIKEIAKRAGYDETFYEICKEGLDKFAEFIVQECADQCDPEAGLKYSPNAASSRNDCKQRILEHFGIEQ